MTKKWQSVADVSGRTPRPKISQFHVVFWNCLEIIPFIGTLGGLAPPPGGNPGSAPGSITNVDSLRKTGFTGHFVDLLFTSIRFHTYITTQASILLQHIQYLIYFLHQIQIKVLTTLPFCFSLISSFI